MRIVYFSMKDKGLDTGKHKEEKKEEEEEEI